MLRWTSHIPELGIGGDDATYVALSHSIEEGHYRDEFLYGEPPHSKYPPAFPAMIAAARMLAGPDLEVVRVINLLSVLLAALLLGDALRILGNPWLGVGATAAIAWNPTLLKFGPVMLSEALFCITVTIVLWAALRSESSQSRWWSIVAALFALSSFAVRSAGIAVIVALAAWWLWRRQWRSAALFMGAAAVVVGGWFAYVRSVAGSALAESYSDDLAAGYDATAGILGQILVNGRIYVTQVVPSVLELPTVPGIIFDNLGWLIFLTICGTAGFLFLWHKWRLAALLLLSMGGVLLLWPWAVDRFLMPVVPLVIATVIVGAAEAGRLVLRVKPVAAGLTLAGLLCAFSLPIHIALIRLVQDCIHLDHVVGSACGSPEARSLVSAARYTRDSLPPGSVIATAKPATVNYFSGHQTLPLGETGKSGDPLEVLKLGPDGATYALLSRVVQRERDVSAPALRAQCKTLALHAFFQPHTLLLRSRMAGDSGPDACVALESYIRAGFPSTSLP